MISTSCYKKMNRGANGLETAACERMNTETAPREMEQQLRVYEQQLKSIVESVPDIIYRLDINGRITFINDSVREYGYSPEELIGEDIFELVHPDDREKASYKINERRAGDRRTTSLEVRLLTKNFTPISFEVKYRDFLINAEGIYVSEKPVKDGFIGTQGIARDISERKKMEETIRKGEKTYRDLYSESKKAEEVYRSLLHSSADAIVIYDLEGRTRYISPAFTQIFGWTLEEVEGERIPFLPGSEEESTMAIIKDLVEKGTSCRGFETKRYTKDGHILDVSISASRYDDHTGKPTGILAILRDISGKKKMEAQLQQAQKMEAMGTLAGGVAHDFNNLLMGIQGRTTLMMLDTDSSHPYFEHLKGIEDYVKSAAELTKQLLGFARGGKYEVKTTDLNEFIKKQNRMFGRTRKEITIRGRYEKNLWTVDVDQGQIEQVLLNLYINSWQAMPGGGDLYIQTENIVIDEFFNRPYHVEPGKYVKISVTDTGVGIDEATQQRIFDPFFTTKAMGRGTGLGLASAYGIIKNHGGFIDVYSEKGEGTAFNIYLPASEKEVVKEKKSQEEVLKGAETTLLVDDEDIILDVGQGIIEKLGYKVLSAKSGKEAIEIYKKNHDRIDMVILDMIMPNMGGGDTYDKLKEINPDIKVLLSSGYSINGQASEILERGCNGFIQKPFNMTDFSKKIREILDKD